MSDKNTRAQDQFQGNQKLKNAPHMVGKNEDSKDTRPKMSAPQPLPKPVQPQQRETPPPKEITKRADEKPLEKLPEKMKEAEEISIEAKPLSQPPSEAVSEPPKPDIIRLAKKSANPSPPETISSPSLTTADSRNMDADAEITGELSYAASRHFFGEYLLKMKEAVERQWISQLVTKYTGIVGSRAVIDFKIQPDGRVSDMAVNSSDGDPYFPLVCVTSINEAQPFGNIPYQQAYGLPDHLMNKPLNIRFTFQYN
jgi:outer membrane biosynthesis protein TonB